MRTLSRKRAEELYSLLAQMTEQLYYTVPVNDIMENAWNPNRMAPQDFRKLVRAIREKGDNADQPILVRHYNNDPSDSRIEVVDGAHRLRAIKEAGLTEAIVVFSDLDDKEARIRTITMNKFRGEFDNIRLAGLIKQLEEEYNVSREEIMDKLGYSEDELLGLSALLDVDMFVGNSTRETVVHEPKTELILDLSEEQREIVDEALEKISSESKGESVVIIIRRMGKDDMSVPMEEKDIEVIDF